MKKISEVYNRENKFLSSEDLQKLDLNKFFPIHDENNFDSCDYYNKESNQNYCGLEFMEEIKKWDLFTWDAKKEERKLIAEFQQHCKLILGWIPICNNF